jgi:DNA-binding transcriptional regulator YhcF (GntR family)
VWGITSKGERIKNKILKCIEQENAPLSTRQIAIKIKYSWHTLQQRCLELEVKGKIQHIKIAGSHLWSKKQTNELNKNIDINSQLNALLNNELNTVLEKQIQHLTEELQKRTDSTQPNKKTSKEQIKQIMEENP